MVLFVVCSCIVYVTASVLATVFHFNWPVFKRVNLIADIVKKDSTEIAIIKDSIRTDTLAAKPIVIEKTAAKDFSLFTHGHLITDFNVDTMQPALVRLMKKLSDLKKGKPAKIRIGYFGDSMIEGDLLTQTLRKLLQGEFGGKGAGFVPINSASAQYRETVISKVSGTWEETNFKSEGKKNHLFFSGSLFKATDDWVEMSDHTILNNDAPIEKRLFYGHSDEPATISVNNKNVAVPEKEEFGNLLIDSSTANAIRIDATGNQLPMYGVSFESASGIIVDNFSFRGITGIELNFLDTAFLNGIAANNSYDLLVFQYGVNVLFKPNETNFNWYGNMLLPTVKKLKKSFSNADFIIVSTADRAFRYDEAYKSAVGIDSLIKMQATIAYETGACFYNQFETMGGHNSIVAWADAKPSLAKKDYIHPNHRGAEILATYFYEALLKDYDKYLQSEKK